MTAGIDTLTVLTSVGGALASKTFSRGKDGRIKNKSYGNAKHFTVATVDVEGIAGLARALERISRNRHAFVIRGEPLPGINRKHARRLLHPDKKTGEPATLVEHPRHWFLVDGDAIACPAAIDPIADPEAAVEYIVELLPPELHDAWCWWQFSSQQSVYHDEPPTIRLHLWFWSAEALAGDELKRWAKAANAAAGYKLIDPAPFSAAQAHYVALPDFAAPLRDPLPRRCGLRRGLDETVSLVIPAPEPKHADRPSAAGYEPGIGVAAWLVQIGGPEGFRGPLKSAIASYVAIYGSGANCAPLKAAIRAAIDRADRSADELDRYKSDEHLDELIEWTRTIHGDQPPKHRPLPEPPDYLDTTPPHPGDASAPDDETEDEIGPLPAEFSDDALALQFSARYCGDWRYTALWGKWSRWDGSRWAPENTLRAFELARRVCRRNSAAAKDGKLARMIADAGTIAGVERLARADRRHAMEFDQWDADDWTVTGQAMSVDLRTGQSRAPRREDYATKVAAVAAAAMPIPRWSKFLARVTAESAELQSYLQRVAGYCLTGVTTEHVLFFCYGTGGNGKGVFINTLHAIWGDYAAVASMDTFIETKYEQHATDLAMLAGARLVIAQEVEQGKAWAEAKVNSLTGGDPITARFMRQDFFTYQPKFKLLIAGNHKPSLRSINEATQRRFHLVPFTVTIPESERDKDFRDTLKPEWPGILQWAIEGCLEWQRKGLAPPAIVREASEAYFADQDVISTWIAACCDRGAQLSAASSDLYASWKKWADAAGEWAGSNKTFSARLEEAGFKRRREMGGTAFYGIALRQAEEAPEWHRRYDES
jgi:P4 family phage/plasmid primase-like protien